VSNSGRRTIQGTAEWYSHRSVPALPPILGPRTGTATSFVGRNWVAVPGELDGSPVGDWGPLVPPGGSLGDGPEDSPGDDSEDSPGDGSEDSPGDGPVDGIPDSPEDSPPDGSEDSPPDGPEDNPRDGPGDYPPGDPGGLGQIPPMPLIMRWLGPVFQLTLSCHSCNVRMWQNAQRIRSGSLRNWAGAWSSCAGRGV